MPCPELRLPPAKAPIFDRSNRRKWNSRRSCGLNGGADRHLSGARKSASEASRGGPARQVGAIQHWKHFVAQAEMRTCRYSAMHPRVVEHHRATRWSAAGLGSRGDAEARRSAGARRAGLDLAPISWGAIGRWAPNHVRPFVKLRTGVMAIYLLFGARRRRCADGTGRRIDARVGFQSPPLPGREEVRRRPLPGSRACARAGRGGVCAGGSSLA